MPYIDRYKSEWSADLAATLNIRKDCCMQLWNLIKNIECHKVLEQLLSNKSQSEFKLTVPPLGLVTITCNEGRWIIKEVDMSQSFVDSLNETLRCKESNLYRELYDRNMLRIGKYLQQYTDSQRI